uniref:Olfactory receptor n=1 Tax=Chelydra serpentina TaxID=8475 RepID=A0A8C3SUA7_CHESE
MANKRQGNQTIITEFILLGFGNLPQLQTLLFLLFLVIYIVTMAGNIIIIALVVANQNLHTPMYFFLGNLSCLETCYTSTILPRMLASLRTGDRTISFGGCITQFYIFGSLLATECLFLSVMSYDRYLAICKPLHYAALMNGRFCLQLTACSWVSGFLAPLPTMLLMSQFTFCGPNELDHFFCDLSPVIKLLACGDTSRSEVFIVLISLIITVIPFLMVLVSYACILYTILKTTSSEGRHKAFSTCSSHLTVVILFYGSACAMYLRPKSSHIADVDRVVALFYTVVTPTLNPMIYSLRNQEVKAALRRLRGRKRFSNIQGWSWF